MKFCNQQKIILFIQNPEPTKTFKSIVIEKDIKSGISSAIKERNEKNGAVEVTDTEIETIVENTTINYTSYDYFDNTKQKKKRLFGLMGGRKTQKRNKKKRPNNCLFRKSVKNRK